jgi:diaminohydroxyphosphoribosylaminopyrimidine deaminase/5-amino-6-(5-phosphoribosylamino)uracil reductase
MTTDVRAHDRAMLERAARLALRGHGEAEPNPSVGCVIADARGRVVGEGRTRRPGGAHGEIVALRQAGSAARGGIAWTTLEPCNHHGRTPPCVDALIEAGIARLVVGSVETNAVASGGIARLREAGIDVEIRSDVDAVRRLHTGFHRRISTGRPWVVAKWAETFDGALATPPGVSPWISGRRSLRMVHRERGRVDAILTGIGTVIADDPRLDARDVRQRRTARRVVVDPDLQFPTDAAMLTTPGGEVIVACRPDAARSNPDAVHRLEAAGARVLPVEGSDDETLRGRFGGERLARLLRRLAEQDGVATVLTECGPGLLQSLFGADLVDAAVVFTAPATGPTGLHSSHRPRPRDLLAAAGFETVWSGHRGPDTARWSQRVG